MELTWYLNRFKTMSLEEILCRGIQYFQKKKEKYYPYKKKSSHFTKENYPEKLFDVKALTYKEFESTIDIFGHILEYAKEIEWHYDIITKKIFPRIFTKDIETRNERYGSAKVVWEINRLQFLVFIALNYKKTGDPKFLRSFTTILNSWIDGNPYMVGVNWYSNIEINIRLIVWFVCWEILDVNKLTESDNKFREFVDKRWLPLIYQHCKYSYANPSKYSSANNHLIAEAAGLFIASSYWRFQESPTWCAYAKKVLEKEIVQQHSPNGVNKEESAEYIQFIVDFFLYAYVVGQKTGNPLSDKYKDMLERIFTYIDDFLDSQGNFPKYGDEDDGKVIRWATDNSFNNFKSLLQSASIIYKDSRFKTKVRECDIKNLFLFGDEGKGIYDRLIVGDDDFSSKFYVDEGHYIFKNNNGRNSIYLHFDIAPLGYLSIAAHGHADALSIMLNVNGHPFIVDSGTYTYHTEPEWRRYFIGTLAHNTIRIDGKDQAIIGGPTMWLNHYKVSTLKTEKNDSFEIVKGTHSGYNKEGVSHYRQITFDKKLSRFFIEDIVEIHDREKHKIEIPFHLHPRIMIMEVERNNYTLSDGHTTVRMVLDKQLTPKIISGSKDPILGWYSPSFGVKEPCPVIYSMVETDKSLLITTEIHFN